MNFPRIFSGRRERRAGEEVAAKSLLSTVQPARRLWLAALAGSLAACTHPSPKTSGPPALSRDQVIRYGAGIERGDYEKRLRGMWLAESIANWTGIETEGLRKAPPFFTDADWGAAKGKFRDKIDFVFQDPWFSDDDTDIEYIYLQLMHENGAPELTPEQIAAGWKKYIEGEEAIWVSDLAAVRSIRRGVLPPATGLGAVNGGVDDYPNYLMIDAQLTTELFGALAPGLPDYALELADLPIRNTAAGHAAHAAQFHAALYSLAASVDKGLSGREKILAISREARKYIPGTSKTADIFDFVLEDFLRNCPAPSAPGCADWTRTRDRIYERYQKNAKAGGNGFRYLVWYESSVNFASGVMALLYGQGDLKSTIRIGALSGWDSDNGTATMGGLLGLLNGYDWVRAQFPGVELSDRYNIYRTRSEKLPDHLPGDPAAEDTFTLMARRMLPLVDQAVKKRRGGPGGAGYETPTEKLYRSSANNRVRLEGGKVTAGSSSPPAGKDMPAADTFADGAEHDFSGREPAAIPDEVWIRGPEATLSVTYDREVVLKTLRFIEGGDHGEDAGYFARVTPQMLSAGGWQSLPAGSTRSAPITAKPNQIIDWSLPRAVKVKGVRLTGTTVGGFVSAVELDALSD